MSVLKKFIGVILKKIHKLKIVPINFSIFLENTLCRLRRQKNRFSYQKQKNIFLVTEGAQQLMFSNKVRGFSLYRNGIEVRANFIFASYCLDKIIFSEDDIVIDCGANLGDLMLKLKSYIKNENYIAIEPNPTDFKILSLNNNKSTLINKALGMSNTILPFYVSTENGDSSLIKPKKFNEIIEVPVIKLESLIKDLDINKIKLLKVEAEGYEPEILEGIGSMLKKIQYIAVDGGYERGIRNEQTFTDITNYLLHNGFEIIDINFVHYRALFLNKL